MPESITTIEELQARVDELEDIIIKAFPWVGVRPPTTLPKDYRFVMQAMSKLYYNR